MNNSNSETQEQFNNMVAKNIAQTPVPPKNLGIEKLRIVAMLCVVACHAILHLNWLMHVDTGLSDTPGWKTAVEYVVVQYGQVGVCIFFMISGYFLVTKSFSWRRILTPYLHMLCYTALCFAIAMSLPEAAKTFTGISYHFSSLKAWAVTILTSFTPLTFQAYWFMTAYVIMLLLAPYINVLFAQLSEKHIAALIGILAFLAIWMLYGGRVYLWNNISYAALCYIIGGWIRLYLPSHKKISTTYFIAITIITTFVMLVFNYVASQDYSISRFLGWHDDLKSGIWLGPIIIAACFLSISQNSSLYGSTKQDKVPTKFSHLILPISGSTFGVYLLHENLFGYKILWRSWELLLPISSQSPLAYKITLYLAIVVITFGLLSILAWFLDSFIVHPIIKLVLKSTKA